MKEIEIKGTVTIFKNKCIDLNFHSTSNEKDFDDFFDAIPITARKLSDITFKRIEIGNLCITFFK